MSIPSIDVMESTKVRKTPAHIRKPQILALQAAGMTQEQIAAHFGVSRATICNDLEDIRPAQEQIASKLSELASAIELIHSTEDAAVNYVELATMAKNEAVRLGAQQRIDDLRGIVTEKERIRAKTQDQSSSQPMFVLAPGCNVAVSFNTTSSKDASLHNTPTATLSSDTTSNRQSQSSDDTSQDDT